MVETEITQVFRESWNTYRKVIEFNHLNHREIVDNFSSQISANFAVDRQLSVLDIGVGDGWLPNQIFSRSGMPKLSTFTGVDTTAEALVIARTSGLPTASLDLIQADMSDYMRDCPSDSFDIVMSSYTIHHLNTAGKGALLKDIFRCLRPGGILLWADVYNHVAERSREETMKVWEKRMFAFASLSHQERATIWEHVSTYDLPEPLVTMHQLIREAGFEQDTCCYSDGFYSVVMSAKKKAE